MGTKKLLCRTVNHFYLTLWINTAAISKDQWDDMNTKTAIRYFYTLKHYDIETQQAAQAAGTEAPSLHLRHYALMLSTSHHHFAQPHSPYNISQRHNLYIHHVCSQLSLISCNLCQAYTTSFYTRVTNYFGWQATLPAQVSLIGHTSLTFWRLTTTIMVVPHR